MALTQLDISLNRTFETKATADIEIMNRFYALKLLSMIQTDPEMPNITTKTQNIFPPILELSDQKNVPCIVEDSQNFRKFVLVSDDVLLHILVSNTIRM